MKQLNNTMIAYLNGTYTFKSPTIVHMEVNGVGYEVHISLNTYAKIINQSAGILLTWLQIKEDGHVLFGFFDKEEKDLFLQLIGISGIGASTARIILSSLQPKELQRAILNEDEKTLESIKGIGKRTAQRIVLELKDKLQKTTPDINISALTYNTLGQEALKALMALGIVRPAAEEAIKKVQTAHPEITEVEALIKKVLQSL
ncbi:MAG TPA: Holliday junction branch migration protein RuvA [Chitinophagaceae bacterium]|nr:Holliday junction branch migration protein RuvA [Chitinophagaceae bacterium]